jgi:hypothetical protein
MINLEASLLFLRHELARFWNPAMHDRSKRLNADSLQYSVRCLELCEVTELPTILDFTIWYIASVTFCLSISNSLAWIIYVCKV